MTIVIDRPNGITLFQLNAVRLAIKLEKLKFKHSGGSVRKRWALHFGLKSNAKHDVVIARIEEECAKIEAKGDLGIREV